MRAALECAHRGWGPSVIIVVAGAGQEISPRPFQLVTGRKWLGTALGGVKAPTAQPGMAEQALAGALDLAPYTHPNCPLERINSSTDLMPDGGSIPPLTHNSQH